MTRPRAAISWSGGKDCCLAMLRACDTMDFAAMLTMFNEDGQRSRSHGLRPDIVALQEVRGAPPPLIWPEGWHVVYHDEYLLASRYPIVEAGSALRTTVANKHIGFRYLIQFPDRQVQFFNLHLMTPRSGLEAVLDRRSGIDLSGIPMLETILRVREAELTRLKVESARLGSDLQRLKKIDLDIERRR